MSEKDETLAIIAALVAGDRWLSADAYRFGAVSSICGECAG